MVSLGFAGAASARDRIGGGPVNQGKGALASSRKAGRGPLPAFEVTRR
jgi:hypothetical protein